MNDEEIKLKLLANAPVYVEGIGNFQLPTIKQVIEMSENTYREHLSRMIFSKEYLNSPVEDISQYSDIEVFATLIFQEPSFREEVFSAFRVFSDSDPQMLENGVIYFGKLSEDSILTEEKWNYIKNILKIGNFIADKQEEEYKAGNEKAKKLIEKIKKKKQVVKSEENINLHSIISAVAWRTNGIENLLDHTIYQLYDGYYRLGSIDNYHYTFTGIYTGNIDGSKIKLAEINWANIIKLN